MCVVCYNFHLLKLECPMIDYEKMKNLLKFLKDLKNLQKHSIMGHG
jgi:hypothetical protein